jgi:hypothetical protein
MKILFSACLSLAVSSGYTQSCNNYFFLQNGKTVEMSLYNKKDKLTGVNTYKVSDVKNSGGVVTGSLAMTMTSDKGKEIATSKSKVKCAGGVYNIDMQAFIPSAQMEQVKTIDASSEFYLSYPGNMKIGDALPDGQFATDASNGGIPMTLEMSITNRKVTGKESLTTPAGTWDCFTITSNQKIRTKIAGIGVPFNFEVTEWYAPGFGIVKTESKSGRTEITAIR